jgi:hypothetical protein
MANQDLFGMIVATAVAVGGLCSPALGGAARGDIVQEIISIHRAPGRKRVAARAAEFFG